MQAAANAINLDFYRAKRIILIQLIMVLLLAGSALFWNPVAALSVLLGGSVATVGNTVFAFRVFARYRAQEPGRLLMRFYGAEIMKIVAILAMFAAVFNWVDSIMPVLFLGAFFISQILPPMLAHGLGDLRN